MCGYALFFPDYTLRICPGRLFIRVCIDFGSGSRNLPTTIHPSHLASSPLFPYLPPLCTPSQLAYSSFSLLARSVFVRRLACAVICISALMRTSSLLVPHSVRPDIITWKHTVRVPMNKMRGSCVEWICWIFKVSARTTVLGVGCWVCAVWRAAAVCNELIICYGVGRWNFQMQMNSVV